METNRICGSSHTPSFRPFYQPVSRIRAEKNKLEATTATLEGNTLVYPKTDTTTAPAYHKITIPRGGEYILRLADGTRVWLNSETELEYPVVFTEKQRQVFLKGEAYFEVEKDARHPFVVKADPVEVEVLGTHFNVDAYPGDAEVKTTLLEGSVAVSAPAGSSRITLSPGESAIYNRADKTLQEEKTKENNTATGWRDGHFHFDYLPLQEIARELSNAFHVKIKITDEDIKDFRIRAHFTEGESLDQMLDLLQPAGNFSYSKTNDTILIHSKLN